MADMEALEAGPRLYSFILYPITQLAYSGYMFNVSNYAYNEVFRDH